MAAALAARARLRRDARREHHRHQRQDLRGRAGRQRDAGLRRRALVRRGHRPARPRPPGPRAARDRHDPGDRRADRGADRARPRVRGRRRRLLPRRPLRRLRAPVGPSRRRVGDAQPLGGRGAERTQGEPARLRALEGAQGGRGHLVGLAVGPRPPRLAHRVLGDGREASRARRSRSTAAGSTSSSRTTRTRSPSRAAPAASSRGSGCTTGCSGSAARRCRSRSGTSFRCETRSRTGGGRRSSCCSSARTGGSRWTGPTRLSPRPRRGRRASARCSATRPCPVARGTISSRRWRTTSTLQRRSRSCTNGATTTLLRSGLALFGLESLAEEEAAPAELDELARKRADARAGGDFDEADRLRQEIEAAGWEVRDVAGDSGYQLVPRR